VDDNKSTKREPWNPLLKSYPESRKINAVSIEAEAMFCRLLALCDDHGNYYGRPRLLLTHLWGHRWANRTMSLRKCTRCRNELVLAALVELYRPDGNEYLHVVNCKKMLRSDIKEDVRFPEVTEIVDPQEFAESVTNAARIRYESGSSCIVPPSTQDPHPQLHPQLQKADADRERYASELVALYWETISRDGSKSRAETNCAKLLKTIDFDDLKLAVERLGADHKNHPSDYEYRASNFFGRAAYYKDFVGDAYEPRQAPKSNQGRQGVPQL